MTELEEEAVKQEYIDFLRERQGISREQAYDQSNWIKPKKEVKRTDKPTFSSDIKYLANSRGCLPYKESSIR